MIAIVDYGMGNLRSVQKAFEQVGSRAAIVTRPEEIARCERLVLPGVGAFRDAISELRRKELVAPIVEHIQAGRAFLGICLGLQLLMETSHEDGTWEGLRVVRGEVIRFRDDLGLKVPHMGWNQVQPADGCPILEGIPPGAHFYFVHSYYVVPVDLMVIAARTDYGGLFTSVVQRGRMFATQFHPEKSQEFGLKLLRNFASLDA